MINELVESLLAMLPEQAVDELAGARRDLLHGVKNAVTSLTDEYNAWADLRVAGARASRQADDTPPAPDDTITAEGC
ncbi:MAG: hypothetical protein ACKV2V_06920 [Blastocatellia bacterium]